MNTVSAVLKSRAIWLEFPQWRVSQMACFDSWGSYFYPETIDPETVNGTLRNLYGERDAGVAATAWSRHVDKQCRLSDM